MRSGETMKKQILTLLTAVADIIIILPFLTNQ